MYVNSSSNSQVIPLLDSSLPIEKNETSTLRKVLIVAGLTFTGLAIGSTTAVFLEMSIMPLSAAGFTIGILASIIYVTIFMNNLIGYDSDQAITENEETVEEANQNKNFQQLSKHEEPIEIVNQNKNFQKLSKSSEQVEEIAEVLSEHFELNPNNPKLNDEKLDQILEGIDQIKIFEAKREFDLLLKKVKTQAQQDLILDEKLIEQKFKIDNLLKPLPPGEQKKRREELQKTINLAYINRELKNKGKLTSGERDERTLLSCLDYNVDEKSNYQNKDFVYHILEETVLLQMQKEMYKGSLADIKQMLHQCALNARLKAAGLTTSLKVDKFQLIYSYFQTYKEELTKLADGINLNLSNDFPMDSHSLAVRALSEKFEYKKSKLTNRTLKSFFKNKMLKNQFQDELVTKEGLKDLIERNKDHLKLDDFRIHCLELLKSPEQNDLAKEIAFFQKWGSYIKAEMIQGFEDDSEALGDGVCWAVCQRIRFKGQKNPDITPEEIAKEIGVVPEDRYHQGAYAMKFHFINASQDPSNIPPSIKNKGFDENQVFNMQYDPDELSLTSYFEKNKNKLANSAGWIRISLGIEDFGETQGHSILVRYDAVRNRYWIVDPNVGFLCFEGKSTPENEKKECLNCLKDLLATYYPLTYLLIGRQMVPKN